MYILKRTCSAVRASLFCFMISVAKKPWGKFHCYKYISCFFYGEKFFLFIKLFIKHFKICFTCPSLQYMCSCYITWLFSNRRKKNPVLLTTVFLVFVSYKWKWKINLKKIFKYGEKTKPKQHKMKTTAAVMHF